MENLPFLRNQLRIIVFKFLYRVHDRQYGRVVLWKCAECGLEATMAEQQRGHDDAVKEKKVRRKYAEKDKEKNDYWIEN